MSTVLEAILSSLARAAEYNRNDQIAPSVVLWTDKDRQWEDLAPKLRSALPHFLTLGNFSGTDRTGPAIWLRCMIARTLPEAAWLETSVPILYLPGVARQDLRAVEDCPRELQPLAELQYRGVFWTQKNAKDWTIAAFLQSSDGGLALDVARDHATTEALRRAIVRIAETPISQLSGRRLEAGDFDALLAPDPVRNLLAWLNDPPGTRGSWSGAEWGAFCNVCRQTYGFDPEKDGEIVGGERLGMRDGAWQAVWSRFVESPRLYPQLPDLLRRATPSKFQDLFFDKECWPRFNEEMEQGLRQDLQSLKKLTPAAARAKVRELEQTHAPRRGWVWKQFGLAPLATALEPLAALANATEKSLSGATAEDMANAYVKHGWQTDAAALRAMAATESIGDSQSVRDALRTIYLPWLEESAERFQSLVAKDPLPSRGARASFRPDDGCCLLFVDGLRFDVGQQLNSELQRRGYSVEAEHTWVALPSVTPTAKPAVSPIADALGPNPDGQNGQFCPGITGQDKELTIDRFRKLLVERGIQVLSAADVGDPSKPAWTEYGQIDRRGHDEGWRLAHRIDGEIRGLIDRIEALTAAGWREFRIVTDHGWLLMPGGLPKVELPAYLAETRWSRCAVLKQKAKTTLPTAAWYWDESVTIGLAPGISCFKEGTEYSHGSLSLQECVIPVFSVRPGKASLPSATITGAKWVGLRCRVHVEGATTECLVDLRTKAADATSSLLVEKLPKTIGNEGFASIAVQNEDDVGIAGIVVLLTQDGQIVHKYPTTVGE